MTFENLPFLYRRRRTCAFRVPEPCSFPQWEEAMPKISSRPSKGGAEGLSGPDSYLWTPRLLLRLSRLSHALALLGLFFLAPGLSGCAESSLPQGLSGTSHYRPKTFMTSPWIELKSSYPSEKAWKILKKTVDWRLEYPVTLESRDYFVTAWRNGVRIYAIIDRREPFDALLKIESVRPVYPKNIEMQVREILWKALGEEKPEDDGG